MTSTMGPTVLNSDTVDSLPDDVARPTYDRARLRAGIAHVGVGGFHRAHQAMYVDRLLNAGEASDWAICGIGLLDGDAGMRDALVSQDGLFTLMLKGPDGQRDARVIGSIVEYLYAPDDRSAAVRRLLDENIRIVSLTVTEGGYNVDHATDLFDRSHPGVVHDLQTPDEPVTVFGLVVEALRRRREEGSAPFTVLSCDNIPGNGDVARIAFTEFARLRDPDLAAWIEREVAFPNSMVDRITPVTSLADRTEVADRFGVDDAWPVVSERWEQWVIEDDFPTGRPALENAGVQFVENVHAYELMKLRLLNCTHQAMCYFGYLMGYRHVHEAVADPLIRALLRGYMDDEASPTLPPVPGVDLPAYKASLLERYANADVADTLARLCADTSDRIPNWLSGVIREQLAAGGSIRVSAAIIASWARYAEGTDEQGDPIEVVDLLRDRIMAAADRDRTEPGAFIAASDVFGDLADDARFVDAYRDAVVRLRTHGARATLRALVHGAAQECADRSDAEVNA